MKTIEETHAVLKLFFSLSAGQQKNHQQKKKKGKKCIAQIRGEQQGSGPVLWTFMGRKTLPPFTSLPAMGEIAGANTAPLGGCLHRTKTRARWAEGFHELNGYVFDLERDGLHQVVLCSRLTMR